MAVPIAVSLVIPTKDRSVILRRTLGSIAQQSSQPDEIILIDASLDASTHQLCVATPIRGLESALRYARAEVMGAAAQRNQGVAIAKRAVIGFFDDDILLEPDCIARLWTALQSDPQLGGVNAMITNQQYKPPGTLSRLVFGILAGGRRETYAGALLGPAVNLLPEDGEGLPDIVPVEWLNTTCTFYRREALPDPVFQSFFTGYSLMEDATLSVQVGRNWKLANARTARIFHDSQAGTHKNNPVALAQMELVNRHYVMTQVLNRRRPVDYAKLLLWEFFQLLSLAYQDRFGREFRRRLRGKWLGFLQLRRSL